MTDPAAGHLPHELVLAIREAYQPAGLTITTAPVRERESEEYGACRFALEGRAVVFRVAKTTPSKIGQFVTVWKRPKPGDEIAPLDSHDGIDIVIICSADAAHRGQFVFPCAALVSRGVMSRDGAGGKRGIRVYPPWSKPTVAEAIKTQKWQLPFFLRFAPDGRPDPAQVRKLFSS